MRVAVEVLKSRHRNTTQQANEMALIATFTAKRTDNTPERVFEVYEHEFTASLFSVAAVDANLHDDTAQFDTSDMGAALARAALEVTKVLDGTVC